MSITLPELKKRIADWLDPDDFIDEFQITTEELVEAFSDRIEENMETLEKEYTDEEG